MEAKAFMDRGELVPDATVVGIVAERLKQEDCNKGFILDGFPRTVAQAEALDKICPVDMVLDIAVGEEALIRRLTGRLVCSGCGASSHKEWTQSDLCKECGGKLIQRADDTLETVERRIKVYKAQTEPLIAYYQREGKLKTVDGSRGVDEIQREIRDLIGGTRK
jgi:adenylate kinase